jgi:hypothetical protein
MSYTHPRSRSQSTAVYTRCGRSADAGDATAAEPSRAAIRHAAAQAAADRQEEVAVRAQVAALGGAAGGSGARSGARCRDGHGSGGGKDARGLAWAARIHGSCRARTGTASTDAAWAASKGMREWKQARGPHGSRGKQSHGPHERMRRTGRRPPGWARRTRPLAGSASRPCT